MKQSKVFVLVCAVLLAAGCSSISVSRDFNTNYDFAKLHTYSWMTTPKSPSSGGIQQELAQNSLIDARVKNAVNEQLQAKGYREVTENPDFLVAFHTGVQNKTDIQSWGYGYGYWGGGVSTINYQEGTLILDFIDPETKDLIWRGVAQKVLPEKRTAEKSEEQINDAVEQLLKKFPPTSS